MDNRLQGREKHVTGQGKDIKKRGEGLGSGPAGRADGYQGRQQSEGRSTGTGGSKGTRAGGGRSPLILILLAVLLLGGGGAGLSGLLGGGGDSTGSSYVSTPADTAAPAAPSGNTGTGSGTSVSSGDLTGGLASLFGGSSWLSGSSVSTGWTQPANTGKLSTTVAQGAREKRTQLLGGGRDTVTIMVYMCGTDLESRSGMASSDLQEMLNATVGDKINLIVYTGGCKGWKNNTVSSSVNQIYQIQNGKLRCLVDNDGAKAMTSPSTLSGFIQYCAKNFPASRNELILWDHGGGSLSGYGYDEKYASSGSMNLRGINEALKNGGVSFDFIGFDACLMATLETALMLDDYADYLIASEETEPGVGWYYTDWLTQLSDNPSMPTVELGKSIVDSFVTYCAQKCPGQKTTLSVVDLAELSATTPEKLQQFAAGTSALMQGDQYQTVATARSGAREFASSSQIDQVDLAHLAYNLGTDEGKALADALLGAVKYNRTSSDMTNAYGLSIYFPYQKTSKVDSAVSTYAAIGMDSDYARCIQQFASMETAGQAVSGGAASPFASLFGGGTSSSSGQMGAEAISSLLNSLLGGSLGGVEGLDGSNSGFLGRSLDVEQAAAYLADHQFDASQLVWSQSDGVTQMLLSEEQWSLVHDLELNVFYDDGEGYIDLGLDNVFSFTEAGGLLGEFDGTWLAIDDQPVAYYYTDTVYEGDNYAITGRVPVLLNGERADLLLVFDTDHPEGVIAGARYDYVNGETETVAKSLTELEEGDEIQFVCDYYRYDGTYENSYLLGDTLTYTGDHQISNVYIDADQAVASYLFTDLYCQEYWTPAIP
ncbi:MAG: peptidase C11 [Oscillospiraceae bacterium]|nr:peptidase C11 [Oscillospiraceae bacterium]